MSGTLTSVLSLGDSHAGADTQNHLSLVRLETDYWSSDRKGHKYVQTSVHADMCFMQAFSSKRANQTALINEKYDAWVSMPHCQ
jgi:hypothetical protein